MTFEFGQKLDFILKLRSVYQRVSSCYVGDPRNVLEMLYTFKFRIFQRHSKNKVLLLKTMPIKSLSYLIKEIKHVGKKQVAIRKQHSKEKKKERKKDRKKKK